MLPVGVIVIAIFVIIATQLLWRLVYRKSSAGYGVLPPGSMGLPLIGETLQLLIPSRSLDTHPFIRKRLLKYGPIFRTGLIGKPIVVSADPKFNHYILSQEGKLVELWYMGAFAKLFNLEGESRTNAAGEVHKYIRSITLNHFGVEALQEKLLPMLEEMAYRTLDSWSNQESVDVKLATGTMVFNFVTKYLLGFDDSEKPLDDLAENYTKLLDGLMSLPLNIPGTAFHKCLKTKKIMTELLKRKFNEKRVSPKTSRVDFLDHLISDMAAKKFLGEEFIIQLVFAFLFASIESNSSAITFAFLKLSENPSALEKLKAEHEAILKNRKDLRSSLTWDEYKSMTYTLHVIHETLRLANVTPGILRKAIKDIHFNGYTIPAGWTILVASSALHLNPSVYDSALEFNPSRWEDLDTVTVQQNFMPFGGGMRQCVGAEFGKAVFSTFLHVLVTKYSWSVLKTGNIRRNPLLSFGDGIRVKISKKD